MNGLIDRLGRDPPVVTRMSLDGLFDVLGNDRRQSIIRLLERGPTDIRELSEALAELEIGTEYQGSDRKRIHVSLYQTHVPKLRRYGIVTGHDEDLAPGPNHEAVLAALVENERRVDTPEVPDA